MKAPVIREMSSSEIRERIENEKNTLLKLKMNHSVSTLENPMKLKYARKIIARLHTELNTREREEIKTSITETDNDIITAKSGDDSEKPEENPSVESVSKSEKE